MDYQSSKSNTAVWQLHVLKWTQECFADFTVSFHVTMTFKI